MEPESMTDEPTDNHEPEPAPRPRSRLAVASFVSSLMIFVLFLAPVAAVILGIMALKKMSAAGREPRGRRFAIAGIAIGAYMFAAHAWVAWMVVKALPTLRRTKAAALAVEAADNLTTLGAALLAYEKDNDGYMPPDLQTLFDTGYVKDPSNFTHPGSPYEIDTDAVNSTSSFFYFPLARPPSAPSVEYPADAPLMWEKATWNPDFKINVLFANGHTHAMTAQELQAFVENHRDTYRQRPLLPELIGTQTR